MGPLPNLVYYASICTKDVAVAQYLDGDPELPEIAWKCLQLLPPHHSRLSHTVNTRMFACIIDEPFLYSAISDEALNKSQVMLFLEQLQGEFAMYLAATGPTEHYNWESNCLDAVFEPIFRRLASPLVGIPQKEANRIAQEELDKKLSADADADIEAGQGCSYYDRCNQAMPYEANAGSRSPSTPLITKTNSSKYKNKKHKDGVNDVCETSMNGKGKHFEKIQKADASRDVNCSKGQLQRLGSTKIGKGVAKKMWWRLVKIVLFVDVVICLILLGVWLRICKGFSCMKTD